MYLVQLLFLYNYLVIKNGFFRKTDKKLFLI